MSGSVERTGRGAVLARLAAGDLRGWNGLPDGLTREDADAALGPAEPRRDLGGPFAGELRVLRHHAPTDAAPAGVNVWFGSDGAVGVEIAPMLLPAGAEQQLGAPEATGDAREGGRQLVYARRGLALELSGGGIVERVVGFASCETEAFLQGPLAQGRHSSPRRGARRT